MTPRDNVADQDGSIGDGLRAAARGLLPLLQENAGYGDGQRRTSDRTIDALTELGMFRLFTPRRFGGFEVTPRTFIEISEILGTADASAAWVVGASATCGWLLAHGSAELQEEVFGAAPDVRAAGGGAGGGTAVRDGDDYRVSGKWAWASGAPHAAWATVVTTAPESPTDAGGPFFCAMPAADVEFVDTWHMAGMRGTGSGTWVASDVAVPTHRMIPASVFVGPPDDGLEPLYRLPVMLVGALTFMGPILGCGRAALDYTIAAAHSKGVTHTVYRRQADSTGMQIRLGEAELAWQTARLLAYSVADEVFDLAAAGDAPDAVSFGRFLAKLSRAAQLAVEATATAVDVHGSGGLADRSPLQRHLRDVNTAARHPVFNATIAAEVYGKALLGSNDQVFGGL